MRDAEYLVGFVDMLIDEGDRVEVADFTVKLLAAGGITVGALAVDEFKAQLAGAGTGKTRVISRRVAYAIATGAVHPGHVLVVTFTDKAANEMRERLAALGFPGVQAQTFHAAAFRQLRYFWSRLSDSRLPEVLDSKAPLLAPLQRSLPGGYKFTAVKDLADELEWAKARRLDPAGQQRVPPAAHLFEGGAEPVRRRDGRGRPAGWVAGCGCRQPHPRPAR